jgi:type II secretory pathway component PulJ
VSKNRSCSGFTVLEAAISMTVLAVALLALWGSLVYCTRSNVAAEQRKKALNAVLGKIEELKARSFDTLITEYGPLGTVGDRFSVPTLDDDLEQADGQITFYVDETGGPSGEHLGLPLDLNGDGDEIDADVSAAYLLLPVKVTVSWEGSLGSQRVDLATILRSGE